MLSEFDTLVKKRTELQRWWKLGSTIAQYDHSYHELRVDMCKPSMVSYCGQEYAGAKNYHDAPEWFRECILKELQDRAKEVATAAYEKAIESLNEQIEKNRAAVEAELSMAEA